MKKRILVISISILVILGTVGAYASGIGAQVIQNIVEAVTLKDESNQQFAEEAARKSQINASLSAYQDEDISKFDRLLIAMDATIEEPIKYNDNLLNYVYIQEVYDLSQEQMDYIADLVLEGYDMEEVLNICYFWLDTNEDISIIEEIYALKNDYREARTWIENAFNKVTNNKCGVLTVEDIEEYKKQGLTIEDIEIANVMCRKGVLTIQEILQERINGKNFAQISAQIDCGNMVMTMTEDATQTVISATGEDVMLSKQLETITGVGQQAYMSQAAQGEDLSVILREESDKKVDEIQADLWSRNLLKKINTEGGENL